MSELRIPYKPLQPTVKQTALHVSYSEISPDVGLQNYIYCYWQFKTDSALELPYNHLIVADGCIDVYFDLNRPQDAYVMGFYNKYTEFLLEKSFNYIGIRFLPTMFPQLFNLNAKEISNRFEPLENISKDFSNYIKDNLNTEQTFDDIKRCLDGFFIKMIARTSINWDKRLYKSLDMIFNANGSLGIEELDAGISPRQLRRLFEFYIGDSAKAFSNVVRFQNVLSVQPLAGDIRQNQFLYDSGYYDQAHFIKAFKHFYGVTPKKALGK